MAEVGDRSSERYTEKIEDILCPMCGKGMVRVRFIPGYRSWNVSRIAAGAKRTPYYHEPKIRVEQACSACTATKAEIKEAVERGKQQSISHEEKVRRIQEAGLPTTLEY
ncbi:MAG: hypothetical protein HY520_00040 [Candidatus Aenigmarchaeota archaeon]|nr:hypothetical protein [Candidatus Aenigmarchaeota archaeon]